MRRAAKIKLSLKDEEKIILQETMKEYSKVFNFYSNWSVQNNSTSKKKAHELTYQQSKELFSLPTALIQSARDMALEACKNKKKKTIPLKKKYSSIRYDQRTMTLRGNQLTLSSKENRIKTIININDFAKNYFDNWQLLRTGYLKKQDKNLYFVFSFKTENIQTTKGNEIIGLDRGIINTIATSKGELFSGKELRKNKRKHLYLKRKLQSKGTRSAKRLLKKLSRKEKRFSNNFLHCLTKKLANDINVKTYVLENLTKIKSKKHNKKSNKIISNWGFKLFEELLKYKAEIKGITIEFVDARFTSQICSNCQNKDKENRKNGLYFCNLCELKIHADINAAINIKNRYILKLSQNSSFEQADVNQPNVSERNLGLISPQARLVSY